ncbi:MAG: YihY family inner membrane protein [Bermanella sp.]
MFARGIGQFLYLLLVRFEGNENRKAAAQLTFVTLFAIVPIMTSGYVISTWFPWSVKFSDQFQDFVFSHFVPSSGELIQGYLQSFSAQAKQLTWAGLVILLFSAISLMLTIESAFNRIWKVKSARVGRRFFLYWLVLIVGPVLLAFGFLVSSYLLSSNLWIEKVGSVFQAQTFVVRALPMLVSWLALALMYYFLPSCKVRFTHALVGAFIAATALEGGKLLFVYLVSLMPSYEIVYGAFAAVPLFLLWLYIAWCVVLLGAEIVGLMPFIYKKWKGVKASQLDWALMILQVLVKPGEQGKTREDLMRELSFVNSDDWEPILEALIKHSWIKQGGGLFKLSKDLRVATIGELNVLIHLRYNAEFSVLLINSSWYEALDPILSELQLHNKNTLALPIIKVLDSGASINAVSS